MDLSGLNFGALIVMVQERKRLKKEREMEMAKDDEIMSAEEFFGGIDNGKKNSSHTCRTRGKKALSPKGKLLKFNLLDNDYAHRRRTLGGSMDGTAEEVIERRFYTKGDEKDVLPWSLYGELAEKDGEILKRMIAA